MPRACTDGWLRTYISHQRYQESPQIFHFWTGVSTVAGALRRKVWTDHYKFQYTPNFYIILVAPPGVVAKSTTIRQGHSLLEKACKDVHFGPSTVTWQALVDSVASAQQSVRIPDTGDNLLMSCVTLSISELGTFMRTDDRAYLDQLISLYDAQLETNVKKTRTEEIRIINPWVNLIACTTPSWLQDNFPQVLVGGGLASRMLFVYEDKKQQLIPYPELLIEDDQYKLEEKALVHDLQQIAKIAGQYKLSKEAYEWGDSWYRGLHNGSRPAHLSGDRFAGYIARKQAHVHKLAMVLAASYRDERVLERSDLEEAEAHVTLLEQTMTRVFDSIGGTANIQAQNEVITKIKHLGKVSYRQLFQSFRNSMDGESYKRTINLGVEMGLLRRELRQGGDAIIEYIGPKE